MNSNAPDVFAEALEGCRKLQQEFPSDQHLRAIMGRLEQWKTSLVQQQGRSMPVRGKYVSLDPRLLRPLNEDLARLVHRAAMEAGRRGLADPSAPAPHRPAM